VSEQSWYGVRCVFRHRELGVYEERLTLWRATSLDEAISRGELEAHEYCADLDGVEYVDFAEAYRMFGEPGERTDRGGTPDLVPLLLLPPTTTIAP
jgi:hypothetical protein